MGLVSVLQIEGDLIVNTTQAFEMGIRLFISELGEPPFPINMVFGSEEIKRVVIDWANTNPQRAERLMNGLGDIISEYRRQNGRS